MAAALKAACLALAFSCWGSVARSQGRCAGDACPGLQSEESEETGLLQQRGASLGRRGPGGARPWKAGLAAGSVADVLASLGIALSSKEAGNVGDVLASLARLREEEIPECNGKTPGRCKNACPNKDVTMINGLVMEDIVPMTRYNRVDNVTNRNGMYMGTWANYTNVDGLEVHTFHGVREPWSRMAIHMHEFGGQTCVLSGAAATVWVEGEEPASFPSGKCYYMPPGVYMTAGNMGNEDQELLDILNGSPDTTVCEPGFEELCRGRGCRYDESMM